MEKEVEGVDTKELDIELKEVPINSGSSMKRTYSKSSRAQSIEEEPGLINCLRNERIVVRHVPKARGLVTDPRHILYGGMAENATRTFVVPVLSSGMYVNVLTNEEKAFLEDIMGLEYNALSVYKKENNFWSDANEEGISRVTLSKQDNYFDLSNPADYIKYKILLANSDYIAPSLHDLENKPKETYQFVIISEGEELRSAKDNMSFTMRAYKEFGKIEDDIDTLRAVVELIDGRPLAASTKLEFLQTRVNSLIQSNSKLFLNVVTDPLLSTKVLIKKAIERGVVVKRGDYLYLKSDNSPLCNNNEEPTLNIAAKYLNLPRQQELKFSIEAQLKD